jgi:pyruvate/2-oxoglutarate dehydrogenase complex dihydrolipoamide acyltransferase (E2) component
MQLTSLLEEAQGAAPDRRILFRDQIAPFGTRAIEGVEPWLTSDVLAAFAVRVILRVGQQGEGVAAAKALRAARRRVPSCVLGDVEWALASLRLAARAAADAEKALATPTAATPTAATPTAATAHAPAALVRPRYSPVPRRRR